MAKQRELDRIYGVTLGRARRLEAELLESGIECHRNLVVVILEEPVSEETLARIFPHDEITGRWAEYEERRTQRRRAKS